MKKSLWLALLLTLVCLLSLSACEGGKNGTASGTLSDTADTDSHLHLFGEWTTVKEPACAEKGEQVRSCSLCGEKETASIKSLGHTVAVDEPTPATCTETGKSRGTHCSVCNEVLIPQRVTDKIPHSFNSWSVLEYATSEKEGKRKRTCTVCNAYEQDVIDVDVVRDNGKLGSASKISDTTLIVSIFANDGGTSWDFNSQKDKETIDTMHENLISAAAWLEEQCKAYGAPDAKFICDWKANSDLYYTTEFSGETMVRPGGGRYNLQRTYIESNIDSQELKQRYNAQNILYILYFNTNESNTIASWALSDIKNVEVEVVNIFTRKAIDNSSYLMPAATFAHEILHCFGAYDLYYSSNEIPQEYVDHCAKTGSRDIMYTVNSGKDITVKFTELCAYYVGLVDTCKEVAIWGLGTSTHLFP